MRLCGYEKIINFEQKIRSGNRFFVDDASEEAIKLIRHEVVSMRQLKVN